MLPEYFRCETCGYKLVHIDDMEDHAGHRWRLAAHSTLGEDFKIIGRFVWKKVKRLFGF